MADTPAGKSGFLRASLSEEPLAEFLARISRLDTHGIVEASGEDRTTRVHVSEGEVKLVSSSDPEKTLAAHLESERVIDALVRRRVAARILEGRLNEFEILEDEGVDRDRLTAVRRRLSLSILSDSFTWTEGSVSFLPGPEKPGSAFEDPLPVAEAIRKGIREIQDARRLVERMGGKTAVVTRSAEDSEPADEDEARLLDRVADSRMALFELVQTPPLSQAENARIVYALFAIGAVRVKPPKQIKVQLRRNQ